LELNGHSGIPSSAQFAKGLFRTKRHLHLLLQVAFLLSQILHVLPQVEILLDTGNSGTLSQRHHNMKQQDLSP